MLSFFVLFAKQRQQWLIDIFWNNFLSAFTVRQTSDLADMRCAAIRGLPVILGDDPTEFFTACSVSIIFPGISNLNVL